MHSTAQTSYQPAAGSTGVESTCQEIEAAGRRTLRQTVDVMSRYSIDALRDRCSKQLGRVDILVNAAGYTYPPADQRRFATSNGRGLIDTNLNGALRACQSFYDPLKESGRGRVINIVSLGAFLAFHEVAAYCAAKTGLVSLTRSLACEWAADGIAVNAIAPGVFPTEMNSQLISGTARGRELMARTPMRRFGEPKELVGVAVLLASDGASFLTGQCIVVDGGFLASGVSS